MSANQSFCTASTAAFPAGGRGGFYNNARRLLLAGVLLFTAGRAGAAVLTVSPTSVTNAFNGVVTLTITGLNSAGQTVVVEKFFDSNNSNSINAGDLLVQRFKVTDGQVTSIAGHRNVNVPGDEDAVASALTTKVYFTPQEITGRISGRYIYRVSPDGAGFTPVTANLTVTQQTYSGAGTSGRVMAGAVAQANSVILMTLAASKDFDVRAITMTDASGNFSVALPAGAYRPVPTKSGSIFNLNTGPTVTVNAGAMTASPDLILTAAGRTISGTVRDATSLAGLPAVPVFGQTQTNLFSFVFADASGNYVLPAASGAWETGTLETSVALLGMVHASGYVESSAGSVTGFNLDMPRVTSLIYGSVRKPDNTVMPFLDIEAEVNSASNSNAISITDATGNYSLGVTSGDWRVKSKTTGYLFAQSNVAVPSNGVAVLWNMTAHPVTTHLRGQVKDQSNNAVSNLEIRAQDDENAQAQVFTDSSGNFDLGVYGGTGGATRRWSLQLNQGHDGDPVLWLSANTDLQVADGTDINNIVYIVHAVTAHLHGYVRDENNATVGNLYIYANEQAGSGSNADVQGDGSFDIPVFGGSWHIGLSNDSLGSSLIQQDELPVTVVNNVDQNGLVFRVRHTTGTISGTVKNSQGTGLASIQVSGSTTIGGVNFYTSTDTGPGGNYSLPAFAATWNVNCDGNDLLSLGYQPVSGQSVSFTSGNSTVNFTALLPDNIPPTLTSSAPANGASGVAVNSTISFLFSEPMQSGYSINWSPNVNANQFSYAWSGDARTLTCTYNTSLPSGSVISWILNPSGFGLGFRDPANNTLAADAGGNFTTAGPPPDTTPPALNSSSPANGAAGVAVNSAILFTFSEPMQAGYSISWSGNVNANQFTCTWSGDARTLTCTYSASLPAGASINWILNPAGLAQSFRDVAGNALPSNVSGNFTTASAASLVWTYKPFMPTARTSPRAAVMNGLLYVVGGFDTPGALNALEVYDPNQGTWQSLAPMATGRHSPGVGVINGKLYVAGGFSGGTVLEVYDPATNTWTTRQPMLINQQGAAGVIGNKLYVVGPTTDFTKSLQMYDPATNTWTIKTPMPNPRAAGVGVLNGLLYSIGGDSLGTVEAYDPATDSWTARASLPGNGNSIYNPGVAVLNGKLYVAGGYNHGTTVDVYDPVGNSWSTGPSMLTARGDLAVAALPDKLFAVGGVTAPGQTSFPFLEQLSLSTGDNITTQILRSDTATLAAGLGSGVPSAALLNRLNLDDTAGLTFQSALAGSGVNLPNGSPVGTQVVTIPPAGGQNGFFRMSFVLPAGYAGAQISCGATMDYYGRAFLNGNALTPAIDSSQPVPAAGTIRTTGDTFFSNKTAAFFHAGTNYVDFADINANGGPSAGAFFCLVTNSIGQTFQSWQATKFTPAEAADPNLGGANADFDHDGISNFLEYALHLEPKTRDSSGLPFAGALPGSPRYVTLTFTRLRGATGLTYNVQESPTLSGAWTSVTAAYEILSSDAATETVRAKAPIGASGKNFLRLQVSQSGQ